MSSYRDYGMSARDYSPPRDRISSRYNHNNHSLVPYFLQIIPLLFNMLTELLRVKGLGRENLFYSGVILQIWNREKFWLFSVILKRSYSLLKNSFYIFYVKRLLPELEKGRSLTVFGDNSFHISLQDDPVIYGNK